MSMFADIITSPASKKYYKDGNMYEVVDGGLTHGDVMAFISDSKNSDNYPRLRNLNNGTINGVETISDWLYRYGDELDDAIKDFKSDRIAKLDRLVVGSKWIKKSYPRVKGLYLVVEKVNGNEVAYSDASTNLRYAYVSKAELLRDYDYLTQSDIDAM